MSSSSSSSATTTKNEDSRVAGDNGAIGVSSDGDVSLQIVPDEAFALGGKAIQEIAAMARDAADSSGRTSSAATEALSLALETTQQQAKSEAGQVSEQIVKIGVPAAALAFVVAQVWGR